MFNKFCNEFVRQFLCCKACRECQRIFYQIVRLVRGYEETTRKSPRRFGLKGLGRKHWEMAQTISTPFGAFRLFPTPGAWEGPTAQGELGLGGARGKHTPYQVLVLSAKVPTSLRLAAPSTLATAKAPCGDRQKCAGCPPPRGADGSLPPRPAAEQPEGVH